MVDYNATDYDRVRRWMGETDDGDTLKDQIELLIGPVTQTIEEAILSNKLKRKCRAEQPESIKGAESFTLQHSPIHDAPVTIQYDPQRVFGSGATSSTVVDPDLFWVDREAGIVNLDFVIQDPRKGVYQVKSTGGLASDLNDLDTRWPLIVQAATMWVAAWVDRGVDLLGTQRQKTPYQTESKAPGAVLEMLRPYARGVWSHGDVTARMTR